MERTRQQRGPEAAPATGPGEPAPPRPSAGAAPVLALAGVHKRFPGVIALRDASFDVRAGEVHALLGENGAGKSTLMAIASGSLAPDAGTIAVGGEQVDQLTPGAARQHGVALVHQHPALLPDMTVAENVRLALPERIAAEGRGARAWMRAELDRVGFAPRLETRVEDLSVAQRHLLELMKGLAIEPAVLILDEPTAALGSERVEDLFAQVRAATARGTAVVYISHRLPEVRAIADRVTVMRDGEVRGSAAIDEISDDEMLRMIVGRSIEAAFPPKAPARADGRPEPAPVLAVEGLSGEAFEGVDLHVAPGEIVGVAGVAGNGQAELLRALAGLERASGTVRVGDRELRLGRSRAARAAGVVYLSPDRHGEGLLMDFSVRENAALSALGQLARGGVVNRRAEDRGVDEQRRALTIRTASRETAVATLSGGNQQKVVLARALLAQPRVILADEPTQGVDAGARVEIYRILRAAAERGVAVVVASSDVLELEGLCDRVVVFSRGQVVGELAGDAVDEERITRAILTSTAHRGDAVAPAAARRQQRDARVRLAHFAKGDYAPAAILAVAILALGAYTYGVNDRVLSSFNLDSLFILLTALAFISLGQLAVMFTGGIDISVGPLAGFVVVIASFFLVDGRSAGAAVLGLALMLGAAVAVGAINGSLVRFARFTPIAATLAMYIALQGLALVLRPEQGGYIRTGVIDAIQTRVGPVPLAFVVVVLVAIGLEVALRRRRWGLALRAVGSDEAAARTLGVRSTRTVIGAYVLCSVLTFCGGVMLMAQIGVGDPSQGVAYTLSSITAVVLGGASLLGGRGAFVAALCGAALIQQITNATTFLSLSQAWQYWFVGGLTLLAAGVYTRARGLGRTA